MAMIEAEPVVPSTTQPNLAIASLTIGELLPLTNATTVTQDAIAVILISTIPVIFQRSETNASTSSIHNLIFLPLSNAIAVAAPGVMLLCTPPVVASTSECNNRIHHQFHWLGFTIAVTNTLHFPLLLMMTISTSITSHSMTMIEAESVVPSTTQCNLAIASLVDAEPLPLSNVTPVAQDAAVHVLISTVPVVSQRFEGILTTSSIDQLIFFPLSNAITVAAPVVVLLCTPPVVAPTSESYNHSSFDLHLRLGSDFDTQGVHVVLPAPRPVV